MCSVIAIFTYKTFEQTVEIANANLEVEGKGHSISIHSDNKDNIEYAANTVPVSRVLINQICSTMNGGSFLMDLHYYHSWLRFLGKQQHIRKPDYKHLINITRIGYFMKDAKVPTDEEMWG